MTSSTLLLVLLACCSARVGAFSVFPPVTTPFLDGIIGGTSTTRLHASTQEEAPAAHSKKGLVPQITTVEKLDDFLDFLGQDDKICVVKFHATWCKSCQKFGVLFRRWGLGVANLRDPKKTDQHEVVVEGNVRLAEVEFGANIQLCRALGIKKLPCVHIYKGAHGLVSSFPCGPNKFGILEDKIARMLTMSREEIELEKKLEEGSSLSDHVVTELQNEHFEEALRNGTTGDNNNNKLAP